MDEMNGALAIDHKLDELWEPLKPHRNIMEMTLPYKLNGFMGLSKPVVSMISNWLYSED